MAKKKAKKANGTRPDLIFALRDSGVILRNLPNDLTTREAERISGMLRTLVVPLTLPTRKKARKAK